MFEPSTAPTPPTDKREYRYKRRENYAKQFTGGRTSFYCLVATTGPSGNAWVPRNSMRLRRETPGSLDRILFDDVRDPRLDLLPIDVIDTRRQDGCLTRCLREYRARHVAYIHLHFSR